MMQLRPYQREAVDAAIRYIETSPQGRNGLIVLPTGSGKSLVIANIAYRLDSPVLVLQPSKEILEQNYSKMRGYGVECSMYSASVGTKEISKITFAMIGSIKASYLHFYKFRYVIIDECHLVNPENGMYHNFLKGSRCKVLGLTATPYRLYSSRWYGSMLRFLTRMQPRIFTDLIYNVQVADLLNQGYLAKLQYYSINAVNQSELTPSGLDYTEQSVRDHYKRIKFNEQLFNIVQRLRIAGRSSILVFTKMTDEASYLAEHIGREAAVVTGDTPKQEREAILNAFKSGQIKVVTNVGVLTTGFDFPSLSTVVLARPTRSLSLYYQMVGRAIRPSAGKEGWIVDLCGNYNRFGKVEDFVLTSTVTGQYFIRNRNKQLTNIFFK